MMLIGFVISLLLCILNSKNISDAIKSNITAIYNYQSIGINLALWYLPSLFITRVIYNQIRSNVTVYLITFIGGILAYLLSQWKISLPCIIQNVNLGLFFFGIGYMAKNIQ